MERMIGLGLFSMENSWNRGDMLTIYKYLRDRDYYVDGGVDLFSVA